MYTVIYMVQDAPVGEQLHYDDFDTREEAFRMAREYYEKGEHVTVYDSYGNLIRTSAWI